MFLFVEYMTPAQIAACLQFVEALASDWNFYADEDGINTSNDAAKYAIKEALRAEGYTVTRKDSQPGTIVGEAFYIGPK